MNRARADGEQGPTNNPNLFAISGKAAIVTGAASGLGLSIAEVLAENGARVALFDINGHGLEEAARRLGKIGPDVLIKTVDVSDRNQMRRGVDAIADKFGRLDIAFGNAGIGAGPGFMGLEGSRNADGEIGSISDAQWDRVMAVNLNSVFTTIQSCAFHMKKQRAGRIIITTSIASFRNQGWVGMPYMPAKAGAAHLVRQAALELAHYNITVNAIAPGAFATNIGGGRLKSENVSSAMSKRIPLGRVADPCEIKGLALFLASPASSFVTGAEIPVDGGASLGAG
jgi:NAD(P)-dependent dehydrogenase (short-subunit alcohol dehydrogenase family)